MPSGERWLRRAMRSTLPIPFFGCWLNRFFAKRWDATLGSLWKRISVLNECAIATRNFTKCCYGARARGHRRYDSSRQPTQKTEGLDRSAQLALRGRASCTGRVVDEIVARRPRCRSDIHRRRSATAGPAELGGARPRLADYLAGADLFLQSVA